LLRGLPSWPRGRPLTNRKQNRVVETIKVANNNNNNNNNIDFEEKEIIKQVIKATIKRGRDNFKTQEVTFFQALQNKVKCSKGCDEGHPKFCLIASENNPVIFTAHKNDEIVYSPTEPSLGELHGQLKIPE
jgi:hypothetical protein